MSLGLVGRKIGMTRIFTDDGKAVPVTVLDVAGNRVTQIKTKETDGYSAVQVTFGKRRASRVSKPQAGHLPKAGVEAGVLLREFPVEPEALGELKVGATVPIATFSVGELVDVTGTTKGRGFSGTIKRHGFQRGPETHGSMNVRQPGSIASKRIGKTAAGKRMSGHYGHERQTTKNLEIVRVDAERNLLFLKGAVPGPTGGYVEVQTAKTGVKKVPQAVPGGGGKDKLKAAKDKK